jgi:four helix bundle protein
MYQFSFEKLEVWQLARSFSAHVYRLTDSFPHQERYGLISQLRRAAISIPSNLAEGAGRSSPKDQANFYQLAYGSAMEAINQLIIACDLRFISDGELEACRAQLGEISAKINALRKSAKNRAVIKG